MALDYSKYQFYILISGLDSIHASVLNSFIKDINLNNVGKVSVDTLDSLLALNPIFYSDVISFLKNKVIDYVERECPGYLDFIIEQIQTGDDTLSTCNFRRLVPPSILYLLDYNLRKRSNDENEMSWTSLFQFTRVIGGKYIFELDMSKYTLTMGNYAPHISEHSQVKGLWSEVFNYISLPTKEFCEVVCKWYSNHKKELKEYSSFFGKVHYDDVHLLVLYLYLTWKGFKLGLVGLRIIELSMHGYRLFSTYREILKGISISPSSNFYTEDVKSGTEIFLKYFPLDSPDSLPSIVKLFKEYQGVLKILRRLYHGVSKDSSALCKLVVGQEWPKDEKEIEGIWKDFHNIMGQIYHRDEEEI